MDGQAVQTIHAASMQEALALVRKQLGRDAIILQTRQLSKRGLTGSRSAGVEIVAAPADSMPTLTRSQPQDVQRTEQTSDVQKTEPELREQLSRLTAMVETLCSGQEPAYLEPVRELREHLASLALPKVLIDELIDHLQLCQSPSYDPQDPAVAKELTETVATRLLCAPLSRERSVVALVGPTGVGKTTTLAKLAALAKLRQDRSVAMVTTDTYRIGATEQASRYADILGIPLTIANTPEHVDEAIERYADADLVLIDTMGSNPNDPRRIAELGAYLSAHTQTHLVLSCTMSTQAITSSLERYASLSYQRLIVTKLDESPDKASLAEIALQATVPMSYVTTGQDVPDDIEPADRWRLANWLLGYPGASLVPLEEGAMAA